MFQLPQQKSKLFTEQFALLLRKLKDILKFHLLCLLLLTQTNGLHWKRYKKAQILECEYWPILTSIFFLGVWGDTGNNTKTLFTLNCFGINARLEWSDPFAMRRVEALCQIHSIGYTARFSLHQVHGSQCTKEYYTKYSWRTLADVCMVSEVLRVVPCYQVLL